MTCSWHNIQGSKKHNMTSKTSPKNICWPVHEASHTPELMNDNQLIVACTNTSGFTLCTFQTLLCWSQKRVNAGAFDYNWSEVKPCPEGWGHWMCSIEALIRMCTMAAMGLDFICWAQRVQIYLCSHRPFCPIVILWVHVYAWHCKEERSQFTQCSLNGITAHQN